MEAKYDPNSKTFYDPDEFKFLEELRDSWKDILQEFLALEEHNLHPWPEAHLYQQTDLDAQKAEIGKGWDVFGLYAFGKKRSAGCELCPITTEIVEKFPNPPRTVAFSQLQPGAHILPHSGYIGYSSKVFRAHLGLQIPENNFQLINRDFGGQTQSWFEKSVWNHDPENLAGCCLRVKDRVSTWKDGELMVFDDSHVHEAWNFCDKRRVVLLIDFDRPDNYLPDWALIERQIAQSNVSPYSNGSRGEEYLDYLTDMWGYS
jgi:ornithine lipid ester-linked acyl 2-hydroxylase